jgi:hypothetical protein
MYLESSWQYESFFHQYSLVPTLEQMAGALPLGVKVGSVSTVDVMKDFRQIAQRRFQ